MFHVIQVKVKLYSSPRGHELFANNNEVNNSKDIGNAFNDFFMHVGHNLATSVPIANRPAMSYMQNRQSNSIYLSTTPQIDNQILFI